MGDGQLRATLSPRLPEGHDEETGKQEKPLWDCNIRHFSNMGTPQPRCS